ncbi:unnamed protein product [Absidia cylindrospora]
MSRFLSSQPKRTRLESLIQSWLTIENYLNTATDAIEVTPILTCLQTMSKLVEAESLASTAINDDLETCRPCFAYLLRTCAFDTLVDFCKMDMPSGMDIHRLWVFRSVLMNDCIMSLSERGFRVPLQKLISTSHQQIRDDYEALERKPEKQRHTAVSELSLELVKLLHEVFSQLKNTTSEFRYLIFWPGWCKGLGEKVWKSKEDANMVRQRPESLDKKIQWSGYLMPRFDMFTNLVDFLYMPGETGEIAREAILHALQLLNDDPEYTCYIVEYSGLCEIMVERLALLFALLPKNEDTSTITSKHVVPEYRPRSNIQSPMPAFINNNKINKTNALKNLRRKPRKESPFDTYFYRFYFMEEKDEIKLDIYFIFWEYLNDVARTADNHLMTALLDRLTTHFWHPVICTALSSPSSKAATAATAYTTEMIRRLTDQTLLHGFLVVLVGEHGGVGNDLTPELKPNMENGKFHGLDDDDTSDDDNEEYESSSEKDKQQPTAPCSVDDLTLRMLLIHRMGTNDEDLSLETLRLFDTILETYNQFAIYNLILRNYLDIGPDGEYINNPTTTTHHFSSPGESIVSGASHSDTREHKDAKVRWLVERVLSTLPVEDGLEYSLPIAMMSHSQQEQQMKAALIPGNSYDAYFWEAMERLKCSNMAARYFWQSPYPPQDGERETGRSKPPNDPSLSFDTTITAKSISGNSTKRCSDYEGHFLHRLFDLFTNMLESTLEQNLLVTMLLQKIAGIADKRVYGVICD